MIKLYLSPSTQTGNKYIVGNTNERKEMEALTKIIYNLLNEYDCESMIANPNLYITLKERPTEALKNNCDFYFAIHSNGGGGSGAVGYFHPNNDTSKLLAKNIVNELDTVCPIPSNRANKTGDGMKAIDGGFGEIRSPMQLGVIPILIEVNFHDNIQTANYIINNHEKIANAIVRGITKTLNIKKKDNSLNEKYEALIVRNTNLEHENLKLKAKLTKINEIIKEV